MSGATPGSGATEGVGEDRLKLLHAPSNIDSAATTARLATVRPHPKLIMAFPRNKIVVAPIPQPSAKRMSEQQLRPLLSFGGSEVRITIRRQSGMWTSEPKPH
jgi:hypothetical protein